jgi:hypothetical protein
VCWLYRNSIEKILQYGKRCHPYRNGILTNHSLGYLWLKHIAKAIAALHGNSIGKPCIDTTLIEMAS